MHATGVKKPLAKLLFLIGVIRISQKLYSGKHMDDVQGESSSEEEVDIPKCVAPGVSSGVTTSSSQSTTSALKARTIKFLTKELLNLSTYEKHLL